MPKEKMKGENKKDASKPKRPMSAYNYYFRDERKKALLEVETFAGTAAAGGGASSPSSEQQQHVTQKAKKAALFSDVGRRVGEKWKNLPNCDKVPYEEMAKQDMKRYQDEKRDYQLAQARQANWRSQNDSDCSLKRSAEEEAQLNSSETGVLAAEGKKRRVFEEETSSNDLSRSPYDQVQEMDSGANQRWEQQQQQQGNWNLAQQQQQRQQPPPHEHHSYSTVIATAAGAAVAAATQGQSMASTNDQFRLSNDNNPTIDAQLRRYSDSSSLLPFSAYSSGGSNKLEHALRTLLNNHQQQQQQQQDVTRSNSNLMLLTQTHQLQQHKSNAFPAAPSFSSPGATQVAATRQDHHHPNQEGSSNPLLLLASQQQQQQQIPKTSATPNDAAGSSPAVAGIPVSRIIAALLSVNQQQQPQPEQLQQPQGQQLLSHPIFQQYMASLQQQQQQRPKEVPQIPLIAVPPQPVQQQQHQQQQQEKNTTQNRLSQEGSSNNIDFNDNHPGNNDQQQQQPQQQEQLLQITVRMFLEHEKVRAENNRLKALIEQRENEEQQQQVHYQQQQQDQQVEQKEQRQQEAKVDSQRQMMMRLLSSSMAGAAAAAPQPTGLPHSVLHSSSSPTTTTTTNHHQHNHNHNLVALLWEKLKATNAAAVSGLSPSPIRLQLGAALAGAASVPVAAQMCSTSQQPQESAAAGLQQLRSLRQSSLASSLLEETTLIPLVVRHCLCRRP